MGVIFTDIDAPVFEVEVTTMCTLYGECAEIYEGTGEIFTHKRILELGGNVSMDKVADYFTTLGYTCTPVPDQNLLVVERLGHG